MMAEAPEVRLRRMRMRAWRRGTKEMDLILGPYADANLAAMGARELDAFEAVLAENDQDLYRWVAGGAAPPERLAPTIARIAAQVGPGRE